LEPGFLGKMFDSRSRKGNMQDDPRGHSKARKKGNAQNGLKNLLTKIGYVKIFQKTTERVYNCQS
jgi:hypothetical protein